MKKVLVGLGILLGVILVAAIVIPFLVPVETYKAEIERRASEATGRKLTIAGPVSFSLLPSLAVSAHDVTFANAPGAANPVMAQLDKLEVRLKLLPLLSGEVAIDSFVLDKPVINLEVDRQGRGNWQFAPTGATPSATAQAPKGDPSAEAGGNPLSELRLGDVRLSNGRISYRDAQSGQTYVAEAVTLRLSLPDLDSKLNLDGSVTWNGKPVKLVAEVERPRALLDGKATALSAEIDNDLLKFSLKGNAATAKPAKLDGAVELSVTNLRALAAWLGQPLTVSGTGLGPLSIKGQLAAVMNAPTANGGGPRISFDNADISLDAIRAKGALMADLAGQVPYVKATLDTNLLDLNPYLPSPGTTSTPSSQRMPSNAPSDNAANTVEQGWSTEPLDFTGLRAVNADLALTVEGLVIHDIKIGKGALNVALKDGRLAADLAELALYEGQGQGRVTLDGAAAVPAVGLTMKLSGVQAEPLLKDSIALDRLSGTVGGDIQLNGSGKSQRDLVGTLAGKGALKFENGAIKGINVASLVRNISTAFLDASAGRAQQTDFSELSGSFTMDKGILHNGDLSLLAPLLRVAGAGTVDLPRRFVNYKVTPQIAGTLEGQGGQAQSSGVMVPVTIEGPWDGLSYKPDLAGLLKDPKAALQNLRGLLGNGQQAPAQDGMTNGEAKPANPVDQLRGLFGR
ncbi:MAG TPA: AsmA family protein [Alphaproteobacteria bacterium]|jgi:AsmA protein